MAHPLERLRYHVSGAISRGEAVAITEIPAIPSFTTHTKEQVSGPRLVAALAKVADDWATLARAIRTEDAYASHVSEATKEARLQEMLSAAQDIREGKVLSFTIWQRVNQELTGECVALLAKGGLTNDR